jgi:hypothetical protein
MAGNELDFDSAARSKWILGALFASIFGNAGLNLATTQDRWTATQAAQDKEYLLSRIADVQKFSERNKQDSEYRAIAISTITLDFEQRLRVVEKVCGK